MKTHMVMQNSKPYLLNQVKDSLGLPLFLKSDISD